MKKKLLFLTLLLPLCLNAQVTFHRYLDSTYTWFEYSSWYMFPTFQPPCYLDGLGQVFHRYHVVGEDTIDGHAWYQVHYDNITEIYCGGNPLPTVVTPYQVAAPFLFRIREDSLGNIWQRTDQATRLLYEFRPGMAVGDTLWIDDRKDSCIVASIDTLYLGAEPRQRYWCTCDSGVTPLSERDFFVEGVGFSGEFQFFDWFCQPLWDNAKFMVCVEKGGDTLVLNSQVECGRPQHNPVGVAEPELGDLQVRWLSQEDALLLQAARPMPDLTWQVLDLQGRTVAKGAGLSERIPLAYLAGGLYVFTAQSRGQRTVLKFRRD